MGKDGDLLQQQPRSILLDVPMDPGTVEHYMYDEYRGNMPLAEEDRMSG